MIVIYDKKRDRFLTRQEEARLGAAVLALTVLAVGALIAVAI